MKGKRILVILLSIMMLFTTASPSMIMASSPNNTNNETTMSDEASIPENTLIYTNEDTKEVKNGESPVYTVTMTGEKDFKEGYAAYVSQITDKAELEKCASNLNKYLSKDMLCADPVLPLYICILDKDEKEVDPKQNVSMIITIPDAEQLKNTMLYHQKKDGTWEKLAYKTAKGVLDKDGNIIKDAYVEFEADSFSAFVFATEKNLEKEDAVKDGSSDSGDKSKSDNIDEKPEKNNTAIASSSGSHSSVKDVDAISLYGDAAESKEDAVATLTDELSFSQKKANAIASDMFVKKGNRGEDEEVPRQGDGSNIEYISAKWITGDTVTNDDDSLLYYKPESDNPFDVRLQFNYALSGEHNYEPGDIVITIPENIIKTRSGKYAGHVILPYPEEPSTKSDFNWKLVNGNYVLTNTKRMSAATKGYIQVGFDELIPHELVDMEVSEDFDAYIEVTTHKGNTIALRSNKLSAQFDTEARIVKDSLRKKQYGQIERVPASEIPASQRIEGEEEYLVVQWYTWCAITANTYYTMDIVDHIPQDAQVTSDLKESDVHGFILKATSEDGTVLEDRNVYRGYGSGQTRYYYYKTAYPASQFEPNVKYTFHNDAEMVITEVDPPAEVTNANVQEEDPQLVTDAQAAANPNWSYTLPAWHNPTGHFMVCKNGNDDKVGYNKTHHSSYNGSAYSDIHIWKNRSYIDLWYGIYPSAMNDLNDGKDVNLSYTIDSIGYTMPWMFDAGSYSTDGEMAARKSVNYSKPVTMITEDTGVRIGNSQQKLKVLDDYEFVSIEFPIRPYVYTGTPKNINPDGSWTALTAGDGTFEYVLDKDYSHYPDIVLELYRNGEWGEYATVSWTTGEPKITLKDGTEVSGAIVDVPSDTENFRTKVTMQNTLGANSDNIISQAAIDYDVRPLIKLINTDNVKQIVEDGFAASHSPSMTVRNSVNMKAYGEESAEPIVSIDKEGHDVLRGYTTDIEVYPSKNSKQTIKDADYVNRRVKIRYSAKVEERSVINDNKTYMQAIEDGRLAAETHGVWYDLLPKGVTPDVSTVTLRSGDKVVSTRTIENYKKSGRTLLIVEVELTPVPERYRSGDMYYYEDVPRISFDAWYDFDAMTDYGKAIHNVIAFESSNDKIGTTDGYSGEYDDPDTGDDQNVSTHLAFQTDEEKEWMTDLDPDRDTPSFVYAGTTTSIDIISAARLSLQKDVMVNNDGIWGSGVFNSDRVSEDGTETYQYNEQSKKDNEMVVWEGGLYSYKLRMMPDDETRARDMVIYDSIETFKAGDGNEPIDEMAAEAGATWQGDFMSVDVSQLEEKGCAPVVYYSTIENLALSDENDPTIGKKANMLFNDDGTINTRVWVKAEDYQGNPANVTAVAVDASKKADGSDFTLEPLESIVVLINMRAPSGQAARDIVANAGAWGTSAYAYNNAYLTGTTIDINTLDEDGDNFVRKDYTKVGLVEHKYNVKKVWNDGNNRDGIRPDSITVHLLADGVDTGENLVITADNNWEAVFEHIPYTTPDGKKIRYSVTEDGDANYLSDVNMSEASAVITNSYEPKRISIDVEKNWVNDTEENRPDYITVELYGNGKKITSKRMDKTTEWKCSFTNLYKNENGLPIRYTAKEVFPSGDVKHLSYVANDPDGIVLTGVLDPVTGPDFDDPLGLNEDEFDGTFTNTYHPHGDLYVTKNVTDVTDVSKEQEFSFTFNFNRTVEDEIVPVLTEYDYDVLDENGEVVSSGKVTDNSTVKIKGGQKIHVKEIDEYVSYKVSESEEAGFTQIKAQNAEGIIRPNSSAQALFENKYSANGQLNLDVDKILTNRALKKYQFKFELYEVTEEDGTEKETLIRTATSGKPDDPVLREDGTIESSHATASFGVIRYTQVDVGKTFVYKVKEVEANKPGYAYDTNEYIVRVTVADNGDGTLNVVPTYYKEVVEDNNIIEDLIGSDPDVTYEQVDNVEFANKYEANGEIVLRAWKDLQGRKLTDGEFEFELLDENGQPVYKIDPETGEPTDEPMTATNTEDGSVVFDAIKFDEKDIGKTFNYAIREKAGTDDTVNYDENVYGYSVTVYDNGDGTLSFSQLPAEPIVEGNYPAENDVELTEGYGMGFPMKIEGDDKIVFDTSAPAFESGLSRIVLRLLEIGNVTTTSVEYEGKTYSIPKSVVFEGKDQGIADIFDANGNSFPNDENVRVYVEFDSLYDSLEGNYLMGWITGDQEIIGWNTDEAELPVFKNTLKDGSLSVTKHVTNAENADPDQKFKFKVKLIGDDIKDKEFDYELSQAVPKGEPSLTVKFVDPDTQEPIPNVSVICRTQAQGNGNVIGNFVTDENGEITLFFEDLDMNEYDGVKFLCFEPSNAPSPYYAPSPNGDWNEYVTVVWQNNTLSMYPSYRDWSEMSDVPDSGYVYTVALPKMTSRSASVKSNDTNEINEKSLEKTIKDISTDKTVSSKSISSKIAEKIIPPVHAAEVGLSAYPSESATAESTGTWGTVTWTYYSDGTLVFSPTSGDEGTFKTMSYNSSNQPAMGWCKLNTNVQEKTVRVKFEGTIHAAGGISSMFYGLSNLETIDFTGFDTSNTVNMSYMFYGTKLHEADFTKLNTANVTNMSFMFRGDQSEVPLDLTGLNTANVTNMKEMFGSCYYMTSLNVSALDTSKCQNMENMFNNCQHMTGLTIGSWDTSKVHNMKNMFKDCKMLTSLDITSFDTSHVSNMEGMFTNCEALQSIDLSHFSTNVATKLDLLFSGCKSLTSLDVSTFNTASVQSMKYMFQTCSSLTSLDVSNFDTSRCKNASSMFLQCSGLTELKLPNFVALTNMGYMFEECSSLTHLDVSKIDTKNVTYFYETFAGCSSLLALDLSDWDMKKAQNLFGMFNGCKSLTSLDLSSWELNNLRDSLNYTFKDCESLESLDISSVDTSVRSISLYETFTNCKSLKRVVLGDSFSFIPSSQSGYAGVLPTPSDESPYTGKWIREDNAYGPFTPEELRDNYNAEMAGIWIWEEIPIYYNLNFISEEGATGSMVSVKPEAAEDYQIPKNQFVKFGYEFDHWDDGQGNIYQNGDTIPADTYEIGDAITLTAIFRERNTTVAMENGEFEFELYGNEKATFDNIPAGTAYQVYEETPDGWVLIEQSNVSGNIEPLETSEASFTNKYEPGTATAQFFGTKTLDGQAAETESYSFILDETTEGASGTVKMLVDGEEQDVELPYTVKVSEGGFIQFPAIKYSIDDIGEHTYTIKEVDPNDDHIDYDTHTETVTVNVTGDVTELKAETVIDVDGDGKISFANKTRPGELRIMKDARNVTDKNKDDEFTFKVTLSNEKGIPFGEEHNIQWYNIDSEGHVVVSSDGDEGSTKSKVVDNTNAGDVTNPTDLNVDIPDIVKSDAGFENSDTKFVVKSGTRSVGYDGLNEQGIFHATESQLRGDAYAVLTDDGKLIFFRSEREPMNNKATDIMGNTYVGTIFSGIESGGHPWSSSSYSNAIKTVTIADGQAIKPYSCTGWFQSCKNLRVADLSRLDTSEVTSMAYMFKDCMHLNTVEASTWDTSNVTTMSNMFNCYDGRNWYTQGSLRNIDVSAWDTSKVTNMAKMFYYQYQLKDIAVDNWDTGRVTDMNYMFCECRYIERIPVDNWNVSRVTDMRSMFSTCSNLKSLNISKWDTRSVKGMDNMFDNCTSLVDLNVSGINTSKVTGEQIPGTTNSWQKYSVSYMFRNCRQVEYLDLSTFELRLAGSGVTGSTNYSIFDGMTNLKRITLGPKFRFKAQRVGYSHSPQLLPNPPAGYTTGKWIRESGEGEALTSAELATQFDANPTAMADTWVWELSGDVCGAIFDGNGGTPDAITKLITYNETVTTPDKSEVTRPHYKFTGWNTEPDGSGTDYNAGEDITGLLEFGSYTKLYAQWETSNERSYKVMHYKENDTLSGYNLAEVEKFSAESGSEVSPETKSYEHFVAPSVQPIIVEEDDSTVVKYYYDRYRYSVSYDGNGATAGEMNMVQKIGCDVSTDLVGNRYEKDNATFVGWNTEPDGSGTLYYDKQSVTNLTEENNESVTLYAQWLDLTETELVPFAGEIYVTCKPGETIVIPNLPAGTTYTVEEVDVPNGWTQTGIVNDNGVIVANQTELTTVSNRYEAEGSFQLEAHKLLSNGDIEDGQFEFQLLDAYGNVLQQKTNNAVDNNKVIYDEESGEIIENEWYGTAPIIFDSITTNYQGWQHYVIKEVNTKKDSNPNNDNVDYDSKIVNVSVHIVDAGNGRLEASEIEYDDTPLFTNSLGSTQLKIEKETVNSPSSDEEFGFKVDVKDAEGNNLTGPFTAKKYTQDYAVTEGEVDVHKYSHTNNVDDDGTQIGGYGYYEYYNDTVTIPNNDTLHVKLYYSMDSWASVYVESGYAGANLTHVATYSGSWNEISIAEFDVTGDTVSFSFDADESSGGYGYYAVVTGKGVGEVETGVENISVTPGEPFTLKDGEYVVIDGLPHGSTYTVTEVPKENWTLVSSDGASGVLQSGVMSASKFVNAYEKIPYEATGSVQLHAKKTMQGGTIKKDDGFAFELLDENGQILQTKNTDDVDVANSDITFDSISYTEKDASKPVDYDIQVMIMKNGESTPQIITLDPSDYAETADSISGTFTWDNDAYAGCNRKQVIISAVPKNDEFSEYAKQKIFDMSDKDSVDFSFEELTKHIGGEYHYTIREQKGNSDDVIYDTTNYDAVVTVLDAGDGTLQTNVEYRKGDDAVAEAEFTNKRLVDVHIVKKDKDTLEVIAGAKFTIKSGDQYLHSDGILSETPEEFETDNRGRIDVTNVPAGTYTLHETQASGGYTLADDIVFTVNEDGTVVNGESVEEVLVLEEIGTHDITLGKSVSGNMGNTSDRFIFTVHFTGDIVPDQLVSTFRYADGRVSTSHITVGESKTLRVALHHNESITWSGIPHGTEYTITEEAADRDGYATSATAQIGTVGTDKVVRGTLTDNESVTYTNTRDSVTPTGVPAEKIALYLFMLATVILLAMIHRKKWNMNENKTHKDSE